MKYITILTFTILTAFTATAQKVSIKGNLSELKGKTVQLVFDYSDIKIGKKKMLEEKYVADKVSELNKKEDGKGDTWKSAWETDRATRHEPKFLKLLSENCEKVTFGMKPADYIATVKTTFLEPGYNIGISRKDALVSLEIDISLSSNPSKIIGTITVLKATGKIFGGMDFDNGGRITEAYAKAGKGLGNYLCKKGLK